MVAADRLPRGDQGLVLLTAYNLHQTQASGARQHTTKSKFKTTRGHLCILASPHNFKDKYEGEDLVLDVRLELGFQD